MGNATKSTGDDMKIKGSRLTERHVTITMNPMHLHTNSAIQNYILVNVNRRLKSSMSCDQLSQYA